MPHLSVYLLGPPRIERDGVPIQVDTRKAIALLAYLSIAQERHRRDALAALLWPESDRSHARTALRRTLYALRKALADPASGPGRAIWLDADREGVVLNPSADLWLDVQAFHEHLAACHEHGHPAQDVCPACLPPLTAAAELYRDDFLSGFGLRDSVSFDDWQLFQADALRRAFAGALEKLARCHSAQGTFTSAIGCARRWLSLDCLNEAAHCQLMQLYAWADQRAAALRQYRECTEVLKSQLGASPQETTTALYAAIAENRLHAPPRDPGFQQAAETIPERVRLQGERRRATIVYAGVSGATVLGEQVDVEAWVEIMDRAFHILRSESRRFGGEVNQHQDSLLALFGARTTHEDDPERAVRAALAMQRAVRRYATELARQQGIDLDLRVGVNTGDVIASPVGRRQYGEDTAMGQAIALAARIGRFAAPGTVLVSESTYRLVQALFEWEQPREATIAGPSQPARPEHSRRIAVYRPSAAKVVPGKPRGIAGLEAPLVGREDEFRTLQKAVRRLRTGVGGIITLVGEAGIGKSRLIAEVREWTDVQWIEGRCLSYTMNVAYQLWLDMLRARLGVTPDASPGVVRATLERWVQMLCPDRFEDVYPYLGRMASLPLEEGIEAKLYSQRTESLKANSFRAVETMVASAARQGPLIVVCEDLHWADPTSLELLEQMLALTDRVPLLIICVFRPEPEHGCWQIKEIAARRYRHRYTDLWLGPLSDAESEALAEHLLRVEGLSPRLRARILDHAEGNPFYVEEILRSLIDGEVIVHDEATGRWYAAHDIDRIPFPDTLHGVLMARIDRLQAGPKHILQLASVIGRIFSYPVLSEIVAKEGGRRANEQLDEHLVALQRAQMIRERARVPEQEYIFKHELTREATYNGLLRRERRAYHRQVAEALERLYPERLEEQVELLAHHWERADAPDTKRAAEYLWRAGRQACNAYANREAIAHLTRALTLLGRLPETPERSSRELDLLITLGIPLTHIKGHASVEVRDTYARARDLCELVGDDAQRFSVLVGLRRSCFMRGELPRARKLCEQLLSMATDAHDPSRILWSYMMYVEILYFLGEFTQVRACCEQASALYGPSQHSSHLTRFGNDGEVGCRLYEALALWHLGYPDQSLRRMRVALDLAEALSHPFALVFAFLFAAILHQLCREPRQVKEQTEAVMRISAERGFALYSAMGESLHGWALVQGREEKGIAQLEEGIAAQQAMGAAALVPEQLISLVDACGSVGRVQEALSVLDKTSCLIERTGERCWEAELHRLKGELLLAQGRAENIVAACFQRAIDVARHQNAKSWELRAATSLARFWQTRGDQVRARRLLQGIYDWFTEGFDTADLQEARALLEDLA